MTATPQEREHLGTALAALIGKHLLPDDALVEQRCQLARVALSLQRQPGRDDLREMRRGLGNRATS